MIKYKVSDELRKTFEFDMLAGVICYVISFLCKFVILVYVDLLYTTWRIVDIGIFLILFGIYGLAAFLYDVINKLCYGVFCYRRITTYLFFLLNGIAFFYTIFSNSVMSVNIECFQYLLVILIIVMFLFVPGKYTWNILYRDKKEEKIEIVVLESDVIEPEFFFIYEDNKERHGG